MNWKMIALGVLTFFTVGIPMECALDSIFTPEPEPQSQRATSDRFIAAQREGQAVPPINPEGNRKQQRRGGIGRKDCTAANLHPMAQSPMAATVLRVVDGDTLLVSVEGIEMKVRLWGIDAPEKDQRKGREAQRQLRMFTPPDSRVVIHPLSMDRYGRVVGNVGESSEWAVNVLMVAHGWAYHYREFSARTNTCLLEAERTARDSRSGVWISGVQGGIRPWEHRRNRENPPDL